MLSEEFVAQGNWLFRHRGVVPAVSIIPFTIAVLDWRDLYSSHYAQNLWAAGCLGISIIGLLIRAATIGRIPRGTSGCNTHGQKAARLNTTGMYSLMRNPLYFGNFMIWLGIMAVFHDFMLLLWFLCAFWLYYERIILAEELFLEESFGESYRQWARRTPAFWPRLSGWERPALPFSIRAVLRRDYGACLGVTAAYYIVDAAHHLLTDRVFRPDPLWTGLLVVGLFQFLVLRSLKKHTAVLDLANRELPA